MLSLVIRTNKLIFIDNKCMDDNQRPQNRNIPSWMQPLSQINEVDEKQDLVIEKQDYSDSSSSTSEKESLSQSSHNASLLLDGALQDEDNNQIDQDLEDLKYNEYYKYFDVCDFDEEEQDKKQHEEGQLNPNPDFLEWDFHRNELEPTQYTYSSNLESLRMTINTFIKKPIRNALPSNLKKVVITVQKEDDCGFEQFLQSKLGCDQKVFEPVKVESLINQEYTKFISRKYIHKKRNNWLQDHCIEQFHHSKIAKKLCKIYQKVESCSMVLGQFPCLVSIQQQKLKTERNEQTSLKKSSKTFKAKMKRRITIGKVDKASISSQSTQAKSQQLKIAAEPIGIISPLSNKSYQMKAIDPLKFLGQKTLIQLDKNTTKSMFRAAMSQYGLKTNVAISMSCNQNAVGITSSKQKQRMTPTNQSAALGDSKEFTGEETKVSKPEIGGSKRYSTSTISPLHSKITHYQNKIEQSIQSVCLEQIDTNSQQEVSLEEQGLMTQSLDKRKKSVRNSSVAAEILNKQFPLIRFDKQTSQQFQQQPNQKDHIQKPIFKAGDSMFEQHLHDMLKGMQQKHQVDQSNLFQQYYAKKLIQDQRHVSNTSTNFHPLGNVLQQLQQKELDKTQRSQAQSRQQSSQKSQDQTLLNTQSVINMKQKAEDDGNFISNKTLPSFKMQSHLRNNLNQNSTQQFHNATSFPHIQTSGLQKSNDPLRQHLGIPLIKTGGSNAAAKIFGSGSQRSLLQEKGCVPLKK